MKIVSLHKRYLQWRMLVIQWRSYVYSEDCQFTLCIIRPSVYNRKIKNHTALHQSNYNMKWVHPYAPEICSGNELICFVFWQRLVKKHLFKAYHLDICITARLHDRTIRYDVRADDDLCIQVTVCRSSLLLALLLAGWPDRNKSGWSLVLREKRQTIK